LLSVGAVATDDRETARIKRLVAGVLWASLVTSVIGIVQFFAYDLPWAAATLAIVLVASIVTLLVLSRRPSTFPGVTHGIIGVTVLVAGVYTILFGGFLESGANGVWGALSVFGAMALFADRRATFWLVAYVMVLVGSAVLAGRIEPIYVLPNAEYFAMFNLIGTLVFTYYLLLYYVRQRKQLLDQSDALLRNILPDEIAERLKTSDGRIADEFDSVSILFADAADFTPMSARMTPSELVGVLDEVFTVFDDLVEERDLEKIKTIGDAYMVAAGIPVPRDDHATVICDLALAMQDAVAAREFHGHRLQFKIGISSGPVVAGIIGRKKFNYDLWGDAVNVASRMESSGEAGTIRITSSTCDLVADQFECVPIGDVDIKGKGSMQAFYVIRNT
jgi:guanylate cyclase